MISADQQIDASQWMDKYYSYLKNYAGNHIHSKWDVEEVVQETFYAGLKSKKGFEYRSSERTWLTSILRNKIVDHYRRQYSKKGQAEKHTISHEEHKDRYLRDVAIINCEDTMFADLECKELRNLLELCIEKLPNTPRQVVKFRIYDQLSTEEISGRLNISKGHVWVCMYRARKAIAKELYKFDYAV